MTSPAEALKESEEEITETGIKWKDKNRRKIGRWGLRKRKKREGPSQAGSSATPCNPMQANVSYISSQNQERISLQNALTCLRTRPGCLLCFFVCLFCMIRSNRVTRILKCELTAQNKFADFVFFFFFSFFVVFHYFSNFKAIGIHANLVVAQIYFFDTGKNANF